VPTPELQASLSVADWLRLLAAALLFLGPGYGLFSFYPGRDRFDRTQTTAAAIGLAISFWSVLLAWLRLVDLELTPTATFIILGAGWAIGLIRTRPWVGLLRSVWSRKTWGDLGRIALWGILAVQMAVGICAFRDIVFGLGSDSYHHTLIAQMIADQGALPNDYQPYAPLVTYTYHFGFHSLVAAVSWLTGLSIPMLVPALGLLLSAAAALSVAFFTQIATRNRSAGTVSAAFTGLISILPFFLLNWGRYTQLTGLIILPILLGLIWDWIAAGFGWSPMLLIGVLASGIALAHYRVTLIAGVAVLVFVGLELLFCRTDRTLWTRVIGQLILAGGIAAVLLLPWAWHLLSTSGQGYPIDVGSPAATSTYYRLSRLGPGILEHSTNYVFFGLTILAAILGWWRREPVVIALSIWVASMLLASVPWLGGIYLDRISVIVSLYFPASVAVGWASVVAVDWLTTRWRPFRWIVWVGLLCLLVWGAVTLGPAIDPSGAFVGYDDLPAMAWIQSNTPASAHFLVNTLHWAYLPDYVIGSDAGYWIPLLAGRSTITLPMTYVTERSISPDPVDGLIAIDHLKGDLTSPEAVGLLQREGITHVYIGQRGGPISPEVLLRSPVFELEYQNGTAYVFQFVESR
jgi:hypothetical protein